MSSTTELVPVHKSQGHIPIAQMRAVFRPHEVERRLERGHKPEDPGPFIYFRNGKSVIDQI